MTKQTINYHNEKPQEIKDFSDFSIENFYLQKSTYCDYWAMRTDIGDFIYKLDYSKPSKRGDEVCFNFIPADTKKFSSDIKFVENTGYEYQFKLFQFYHEYKLKYANLFRNVTKMVS